MSGLFDDKGHLSIETLQAIKTGTISEIEMIHSVTHIGECESCANCYADIFGENELFEAPGGLEEEVRNKLKPKHVKDRQFIYYSLRVAVAACIALMIVFSGILDVITSIDARALKTRTSDFSIVNSINSNLKGFSDKILNMEVLKNEKKKK